MGDASFYQRELSSDSLRITFLCPLGWKARESARPRELDVHLLGPRNRANTYSTSLAIHVAPAGDRTAQSAAQELLNGLAATVPSESRGPTATTVAARPALRVDYAYSPPLPLNSLAAQPTPIREAVVFLRWGDRLVELRFAAVAEEFVAWQGAFDTLLSSFRVRESSPVQPLAVHEPREHYQTSGAEDDGAATDDGN